MIFSRYFLGLVFLSLCLFLTIFSNANTNLLAQCPLNNYIADIELGSNDDLKINSDIARKNENKYTFIGDALVNNKNQALFSQKINYDENSGQAKSESDDFSIFKQNDFLAKTDKPIEFNFQTKQLNSADISFEIKKNNASGFASEVYTTKEDQGLIYLKNLNYTHCNSQNPSWQVSSSFAKIDNKKEIVALDNPVFKISDTPIFWLPYISFPLNDRASGLLSPEIQIQSYQNKTRYIYSQPYYFNLAPNYDLTTTLIVDNIYGQFLSNEFRFLTKNYSGDFKLHWLTNENDESKLEDKERWFANYQQSGKFKLLDSKTNYTININRVSDINYIEQFKPNDRADTTRLLSNVSFNHSTDIANLRLNFQDSQRLISDGDYYVKKTHFLSDFQPIEIQDSWFFDAKLDYAKFKRDDEKIQSAKQTGNRLFNQIRIFKNFITQGYSITPEVKLNSRSYNLDENNLSNQANNQSNLDAMIKLDGKLMLTRDANEKIRQDLDIRVLYLDVITNENKQIDFPIFDTGLLAESSYLFKDNRYTGLDRQSDDKKIALSITTSLFNKSNSQRIVDFSVAQAYYFNPLDYYTDSNGVKKLRDYSDIYLSSNLYYKPFVFKAAGQMDVYSKKSMDFKSYQLSVSQNQYNPKFSFTYYKNSDHRFISSNLNYQINKNKINLNSIYSFEKNQTESFGLSLLQDDCCYKISASLSKIRKSNNLFETQVKVFIEFKGLGSLDFQ